ncbi:MAG: DUF4416 family protein, partial [Planctomycetales bacterium]
MTNKVLRILAAFSRYGEALDWAAAKAEQHWGQRQLESPRYLFAETDYYTASMGQPLHKMFWAFSELADPAGLADWKIESKRWEVEYLQSAGHPEVRP